MKRLAGDFVRFQSGAAGQLRAALDAGAVGEHGVFDTASSPIQTSLPMMLSRTMAPEPILEPHQMIVRSMRACRARRSRRRSRRARDLHEAADAAAAAQEDARAEHGVRPDLTVLARIAS